MHKNSLIGILLLGVLSQSAGAADIMCPSVEQIQQANFTQAMSPMEGEIFATSELLALDSNHIWSVVIHGLAKADVEEANEKVKLVDICESEVAVAYHSNLFDSLACDYRISSNIKVKVHAVIAKDNNEETAATDNTPIVE